MKKYIFLALLISMQYAQSSFVCDDPNSIFYNATEYERDVMLGQCRAWGIEPRTAEEIRLAGLARTAAADQAIANRMNNNVGQNARAVLRNLAQRAEERRREQPNQGIVNPVNHTEQDDTELSVFVQQREAWRRAHASTPENTTLVDHLALPNYDLTLESNQ